jgi:hypothetical protein
MLCHGNLQVKNLLTQEDEIDGSFLKALMVCIDIFLAHYWHMPSASLMITARKLATAHPSSCCYTKIPPLTDAIAMYTLQTS